ncbi:bifunctional UDP-4-keto-pentose/UDP-xylose synthase [Halorubrum vacuolatum]|uniref:UDP-apiose/xylose synthase n=1 Tax=Halorubrum vacuolatum TaxID=63740 RepID=A0A238XPQ1_HALVU|nr:bifunctional UDP-4-keto-pentose/UDP-xylose synthase [Halorubrum vacuolatum]SNR61006.1 UDP-apiose/xylose synthase [Halorubrum vacuolatum]
MSQVVVFGGGGFIGSHLCRRLVKKHDVEIIDIDLEKVEGLRENERTTFHELDIRDAAAKEYSRGLIEEADIVIDLIAYANPQQYVDIPVDVVHLNYDTNLEIVEVCAETDTRLIQFSTCEVYGKVGARTGEDVEFDEDTSDLVMGPVDKHRWIYATAKQLLERMVHAHGLENDLDWTIVRPFNVIGPQMDYIVEDPGEGTPRVFASFMSSLLYNHPMHLIDGGQNRRAFTHILDAVNGLEAIIENYHEFNREIVNVGNPSNEVTIAELANRMRAVYQDLSPDGSLPETVEISGTEFYGEGYEDGERRVPNISKLTSVGWEPEYDLDDTLRDGISYYVDIHERPGTTPDPSFE